jgi:hypothetical protein
MEYEYLVVEDGGDKGDVIELLIKYGWTWFGYGKSTTRLYRAKSDVLQGYELRPQN